MTLPETPPAASDDDLWINTSAVLMYAFSGALVLVGLVGAFLIVEQPTVTPKGLLIGAALGLVSWFVPSLVIRARLDAAARAGVAAELVPATVRSAMFLGLACAEMPPLLAFAFAVPNGNDVGTLVLSIPLAIASLILNVGGKGANRRHLERLRSPFLH